MKANDLRAKSAAENTELLGELFREQFNLKMHKATGQLSKFDRIRTIRRDVARIKTIMHERSVVR